MTTEPMTDKRLAEIEPLLRYRIANRSPGQSQALEELIAEVKRLRAETPAPERPKWRDIETAPRDGTIILYAGRNGPHQWVTAGRWTEHGWYEINLDSSDVHGGEDYPERWKPLPDPPTEVTNDR